ncbi:MAG: sn-glycerol-3-phosphate ABC transporter substrate-binding protein UgpB [Pseudomonadota bacterium]
MLKYLLLILSLCFASASAIQAKTRIVFWHSMGGQLGVILNHLVKEFNDSQHQYVVDAIYKGQYAESLTSTVAAFHAHKAPDLVQVFEVGTATMLSSKAAIVPVYRLMKDNNIPLSSQQFFPAIGGYYSNTKGQLMAFPFNSSSPVLYYNKEAFRMAGLNPNKPPKTWPQLEADSKQLLKAGYQCGFTTAWPSWIQLEVFSAWHNKPFATQGNGLLGNNPRVKFNYPLLVKHIATLGRWQKEHIFEYGGQESNAIALFETGVCPMITDSSGALASLSKTVKFPLAVGYLPYWPADGVPQNTSIGGAALWVMAGHSKHEYKGIAEFLQFLAKAKIQAYWSEKTGYLPVTMAAYNYIKNQGYYQRHPNQEIAIKELNHKPPTRYSKGIRLGNYSLIRKINSSAIEAVMSQQMTAKQALDKAVKEDNLLLEQFHLSIQ